MVGANIKRLRQQKGITQTKLARKIGLRQESLSRIELGRYYPSLVTLERIVKALGVSIRELLDDQDQSA